MQINQQIRLCGHFVLFEVKIKNQAENRQELNLHIGTWYNFV